LTKKKITVLNRGGTME